MMRASSTAASDLPSLVMLNAGRINFDGKLDFSPLEKLAKITKYDTTSEEQIIERVQGKVKDAAKCRTVTVAKERCVLCCAQRHRKVARPTVAQPTVP